MNLRQMDKKWTTWTTWTTWTKMDKNGRRGQLGLVSWASSNNENIFLFLMKVVGNIL
jgi:hypothetical protein